MPGGFIPDEDKGYLFVAVQLPEGASLQRSDEVLKQVEDIVTNTHGVRSALGLVGFNILNSLNFPNTAMMFVGLEPWDERTAPELQAKAIAREWTKKFAAIPGARAFAFGPPPLPGYGNVSGFTMQLQDRSGGSVEQLAGYVRQLQAEVAKHPEIASVSTSFNPSTPQVKVELDREKARTLGVPVDSIFQTLQAYLSGLYVNDFVRFGKVYKVFLQAEPEFTSQPDEIGQFYVRNHDGKMVPLNTLVKISKMSGPNFVSRFNLYNAAEIIGAPAPGYSSSQAIKAIEEVMKTMPSEVGYEWSGLTLQEKKSEGQAPIIFGAAVLFVFLLLAAQYESWGLPFAVLLATPTVILGFLIGMFVRHFELNVYAQIGLVMLIGLAAKNAILIVEFAKMKREEGVPIIDAATEGSRLRLRPILMTSFAFILGCVPLMLATGSGAAARSTMGTGVVFGMSIATLDRPLPHPRLLRLRAEAHRARREENACARPRPGGRDCRALKSTDHDPDRRLRHQALRPRTAPARRPHNDIESDRWATSRRAAAGVRRTWPGGPTEISLLAHPSNLRDSPPPLEERQRI